MEFNSNKKYSIGFICFFAFILTLYLLFPSTNNSGDSWGYAGDVKWGKNLFYPHHLLYTGLGFLWVKAIGFSSALRGMILLNALSAIITLIVLSLILFRFNIKGFKNASLVAIAAFSFGFWRFATENETYQLPILFSLLSAFYFVVFYKKERFVYAFLSGLFASIACLFHQIHIFWWLGQLVGLIFFIKHIPFRNKWRSVVGYIISIIICPVAYMLAVRFYLDQSLDIFNIVHFVFHDYYAGEAGYSIGIKHFLLGVANSFRTFFQVHGVVKFMLESYYLLWLIVALTFSLIIYGIVQLIRSKKLNLAHKPMFFTFGIVLILQWLFAVYNVGNAEFMAMIPPLLVIMVAYVEGISVKALMPFAIALLIWNFTFGICPLHSLKMSANAEITKKVELEPEHLFMLSQHALVDNMVYYNIGREPSNIISPPSKFVEKNGNFDSLRDSVNVLLKDQKVIYTDCTGFPEIASRSSLLNQKVIEEFMGFYNLSPIINYKTDIGEHRLFRLKRK